MNNKRLSKPDLRAHNSSDDDFEDKVDKHKDTTETDRTDKISNSFILEEIRRQIPPPNPLLPKSFFVEDEGAMTGGLGKLFLLKRFKGLDREKDLLNNEVGLAILQSQYSSLTSLYKIFNPYDENEELREEIVYYRDIGTDQTKALTIAEVNKNGSLFNTNQLDVKKLLKTNMSFAGK